MAVAYEELENSPVIDMDRKGGGAQRMVRIDWDDINLFFAELFPNPRLGYLGAAYFPGYRWLKVSKVRVEPFDPATPAGRFEPMNVYDWGAKVTITYSNPSEDQGMQGGAGGDHSGPGGADGSGGGSQNQGEDQAFVSHKVSVGGEFLTQPTNALRWELPKNGLIDDPLTGKRYPDSNWEVGGDLVAGSIIPLIEHSITWHFVPWPPWNAIRQCVGKVNAYRFAGCGTGTLLFMGVEASREITSAGVTAWTMEYKFSEKNLNPLNPLKPMGWHYFMCPDGIHAGNFVGLWRKTASVQFADGTSGRPWTLLNAALSANGVTAVVDDPGNKWMRFPSSGQIRIIIDPFYPPAAVNNEEYAAIIGGQGTDTWTLLRGMNGGRAKAHAAGAKIIQGSGRVYDEADFRYLFVPGIPR